LLTPWEIKDKEMIPPRLMLKMNIAGLFALFKVLITNLPTIKAMKTMKAENAYVRPTPSYTLPDSLPASVPHCNQRYLRQTLFCNNEAPLVNALAKQLGAGEKSPLEFAQAAFEFTKRNIILEMTPIDDVTPILQRGTGTCIHKMSVFIALCRAAGIPARYKFFALTVLDDWAAPSLTRAPLMKKWYDAMGLFLLHGEGEILIDGKWIAADVGAEPSRQANSGLPITKLGEESIGMWLFPIPGTMFTRESIPLGLGLPSRFLMDYLVPSSVQGINAGILDQIRNGMKIIEEAGGEQAYDAQARKKRSQQAPHAGLQASDSIVFEDEK
jgi:hypothetical protein